MVAIKKGDLVLVTGASGFISSHTVEAFLKGGYRVRGTVRDKNKGEYLKDLYKGQGEFEYVIVEDIGQDNAFDEAVEGVDGVAHMASPFHFEAEDPQELFTPAVNGTVGILKSLQKRNPNAKRVVITSSVAAVMDSTKTAPYTFTEKDWNPISIPECEKKGKDASGSDKYRASKTLAEKAFWQFIADERPTWDGVTINPPLVLGPVIHQCNDPAKLNTSVAMFYQWMTGAKKQEDLPAPAGNWVDVRDCALAHVRALEVPEASGERFISSAGPLSGNDHCLVLNKLYPERKDIPKGDPSARDSINANIVLHDGSKCRKVLGVDFMPVEKSVKDMAESLQKRFSP